jgi:hypothetical protein
VQHLYLSFVGHEKVIKELKHRARGLYWICSLCSVEIALRQQEIFTNLRMVTGLTLKRGACKNQKSVKIFMFF